jgi:hypothetical protein
MAIVIENMIYENNILLDFLFLYLVVSLIVLFIVASLYYYFIPHIDISNLLSEEFPS